MIGKRGWIFLIVFLILIVSVHADASSYPGITIKMDEDQNELWYFMNYQSAVGNECTLRIVEEDGGLGGDESCTATVRAGALVQNEDGHSFAGAVSTTPGCASGEEMNVIFKRWRSMSANNNEGSDFLSVASNFYRPRYELYCGEQTPTSSEHVWWVCDENDFVVTSENLGETATCRQSLAGESWQWELNEIDCADGIDNDDDGWIDCLDYNDCLGQQGPSGTCQEESGADCFDNIDNDGDGGVDNRDRSCVENCDDFKSFLVNPPNMFDTGTFATVNNGEDGCCGDDQSFTCSGSATARCYDYSPPCPAGCVELTEIECFDLYDFCLWECDATCQGDPQESSCVDACYQTCEDEEDDCLSRVGCPGSAFVSCSSMSNQVACQNAGCTWDGTISIANLQDFAYFSYNTTDSKSRYFCARDRDEAPSLYKWVDRSDKQGEWHWWDATQDSFMIHTILIS